MTLLQGIIAADEPRADAASGQWRSERLGNFIGQCLPGDNTRTSLSIAEGLASTNIGQAECPR